LIAAAAGASTAVVAVGYADATDGISRDALIDIAAEAGARGVLLDTAEKTGPGLRRLVDQRALGAWVTRARSAGLLVALAGRLSAEDLPFVIAAAPDIVGVRGAACDGGRAGRVSAARVRQLYDQVRALTEDRRSHTANLL